MDMQDRRISEESGDSCQLQLVRNIWIPGPQFRGRTSVSAVRPARTRPPFAAVRIAQPTSISVRPSYGVNRPERLRFRATRNSGNEPFITGIRPPRRPGLPGAVRFPVPVAGRGIEASDIVPSSRPGNPAEPSNDPFAWCKKIPCRYFANGSCILGTTCRYLHPVSLPAATPQQEEETGVTVVPPVEPVTAPKAAPILRPPILRELKQQDVMMDFSDSDSD